MVLNAVLPSVLRVASQDVRRRSVLKFNNPTCPVGKKDDKFQSKTNKTQHRRHRMRELGGVTAGRCIIAPDGGPSVLAAVRASFCMAVDFCHGPFVLPLRALISSTLSIVSDSFEAGRQPDGQGGGDKDWVSQ